jgi:hypothetical protein
MEGRLIFTIKRASWAVRREKKPPCKKAVKGGSDWYIEINSLEDLMQLIDKEGEIIIDENRIIIYDYYNE